MIDKSDDNEGLEGAAIEAAAKAMAVVTALDSHLREHGLMTEEHRREHDGLLREVAGAASALDARVRETATTLARQFADTTAILETRVREVAELHWDNHRVEHDADQRAIDKVERNMVDKFESVNEFRNQQKDIIAGFMPRAEYDSAHSSLVDRVDQLRNMSSTHVTREEIALSNKGMSERIDALERYRSANEGKDRGSAPYTAIAFSVITSVITAIIVGAVVITTRSP